MQGKKDVIKIQALVIAIYTITSAGQLQYKCIGESLKGVQWLEKGQH
jgi:hypothetical protein